MDGNRQRESACTIENQGRAGSAAQQWSTGIAYISPRFDPITTKKERKKAKRK
jgi:hypothetical protein